MKNNYLWLLCCCIILTRCGASSVQQAKLTNAAPKKATLPPDPLGGLQALLASVDSNLHIGVKIISLENHKVLFAKNTTQHFIPASTTKLLTAAAALQYLGPAYRFTTDIVTDDLAKNGKSIHHLFLRGSGDPSLNDRHLYRFATSLKQQGISQITGDIVLDDTAFDATTWGRGWMWDDLSDGFGAPVSGINVANNEIILTVYPALKANQPARLSIYPYTESIKISGQINTGVVVAPLFEQDASNMLSQKITVSGSMMLNEPPYIKRIAIKDSTLFAGVLLKEALKSLHITVKGNVRRGVVPVGALVLDKVQSHALSQLLIEFVKASNNHGMECILKALGRHTASAPGSWQNGLLAVRNFLLQDVGNINIADLFIADGSGTSRYNLLTPNQLLQVLIHMHDNFKSGPEFLVSLPIGGVDGTLEHRFSNPNVYRKVRAKTGSMTGASSLAGYLHTQHGELLAFVIMIDGFVGSIETYRKLQDDIILIASNF